PGRSYGSSLAFQILGPAAKPAIPNLIALLHQGKNARNAEPPLVSIGTAAIPPLIHAAETIKNPGKTTAILALGQFGTNASSASQVLVQLIKTDAPRTR